MGDVTAENAASEAALETDDGRITLYGRFQTRAAVSAACLHQAAMSQSPRQSQPRVSSRVAAEGPPDAVRAAVTSAIVLVLIGLVLSIAGNSDSGSSALVRTVKSRLFSPWLVPAWLDLGFDYRLTYGAAEDAVDSLVVGLHGDRGKPMPLPGERDGERAARWRRLAHAIAADVDDADRDGLLAAAVGRGMFEELDGDDVLVRIVRTPPTDRGAPAPPAAAGYTARVRMAGGEVQLLRQEARGEVAPLVRRPVDAGASPPREAP